MSDPNIGTRFKEIRTALGGDPDVWAHRAGVGERVVRAIEEGRFDELPPGIYARSAIRSYAAALGLDPVEVLHECELLLPPLEEPIRAMGRLRGLRPRGPGPVATDTCESRGGRDRLSLPDWRGCAAAAVDAALIGALLAMVMAGAALTAGVRIQALNGGEVAFGVVGLLLAGIYFTLLGGLCGMTAGGRAVGCRFSEALAPMRLREILTCAGRWAGADLYFAWTMGQWLGRLTAGEQRTPISA